jgi:Flp pilus assembly pilin Flp
MLSSVRASLLRLTDGCHGEKGQALAEYSLILGFIAAASVVVLVALTVAVSGLYNDVASVMP